MSWVQAPYWPTRIFKTIQLWINYKSSLNNSKPHSERTISEYFCCGNTLSLLIKLEKQIQIYVLISVPVTSIQSCPVSWSSRIHQQFLCSGVRPSPQWVSWIYDIKQSDGEIPVMLELWGMWSTPSLPLLPGSLWPGMVAPDRALSMD